MSKVTLEAFEELEPLPLTVNGPVLVVLIEAFKFVNEAPEPENIEADKNI